MTYINITHSALKKADRTHTLYFVTHQTLACVVIRSVIVIIRHILTFRRKETQKNVSDENVLLLTHCEHGCKIIQFLICGLKFQFHAYSLKLIFAAKTAHTTLVEFEYLKLLFRLETLYITFQSKKNLL